MAVDDALSAPRFVSSALTNTPQAPTRPLSAEKVYSIFGKISSEILDHRGAAPSGRARGDRRRRQEKRQPSPAQGACSALRKTELVGHEEAEELEVHPRK
jgi:hypothetical protein